MEAEEIPPEPKASKAEQSEDKEEDRKKPSVPEGPKVEDEVLEVFNKRSVTLNPIPELPPEITLEERLEMPFVWLRLSRGFRIEDLGEDYEPALHFLREQFVPVELTTREVRLVEDPQSVHEMMEAARFIMRDGMSLVAVQEGTGAIVGVLVARVAHMLEHSRTFSRVKVREGVRFQKVIRLLNHIRRKFDIYDYWNVDKVMRIYLTSVHQEFRGVGIGMGLMTAVEKMCRLLDVEVITGIFTSKCSQSMAAKLGMEIHYEVYYSSWVEDGELVFEDPGAGNYTAAMMGMKIPQPLRPVTAEVKKRERAAKRVHVHS